MSSPQPLECANYDDASGHPAGGWVQANGLGIEWQDGPLVNPETGERRQPNGAFVETVIMAALQRIQYYQKSKFACRQNALAITKLEEALHWLDDRTREREARRVEGTHQP